MKKFFMPVDNSIYSTHALQYMVMMAPIFEDGVFSLYYDQPIVSDYLTEEAKTSPAAMEKLDQLNAKNESIGNEILGRRKNDLMSLNVPEERIQVFTNRRREGAAKDILWQAEKEAADAIIIGRHGFTKFQETFIGSTSKNLIEHSPTIPVWLVDGEITAKNILLAVDGSTDSVKALDYLLDMCRDKPETILTIFHVEPTFREYCGVDFSEVQGFEEGEGDENLANIIEQADRKCIDNFMGYAGSRFKERHIHEERLKMKTQPTKVNIGRAIIDEFKSGDYGTLVVGKRGINKRFFMGSVSNYLVTHLQNGALWIIP